MPTSAPEVGLRSDAILLASRLPQTSRIALHSGDNSSHRCHHVASLRYRMHLTSPKVSKPGLPRAGSSAPLTAPCSTLLCSAVADELQFLGHCAMSKTRQLHMSASSVSAARISRIATQKWQCRSTASHSKLAFRQAICVPCYDGWKPSRIHVSCSDVHALTRLPQLEAQPP